MRRSRRPVARRAFTLLEVMIAIGLVGALVGSLFAFFFDIISWRARSIDLASRQLAATTLIERVETDLMTCLAGERAFGAGIEGDTTRLRILSRGVAASLAGRGVDDPAVFGDLQEAEYRFNGELRRIEARRRVEGDGAGAEPAFAAIGGTVHKVRFRFHDGTAWRDSFDSLSAGRLPTAVEVAVWFKPWPGDDAPPSGEEAEEAPFERLTFNAAAGFDERAYAELSDLDLFDEPMPDRVRVIAVPDAAGDDPYANEVESPAEEARP